MIDYFALALTHGLLLVMLLRLVVRPDLDREDVLPAEEEPEPAETEQAGERGRRSARPVRRGAGRGDA